MGIAIIPRRLLATFGGAPDARLGERILHGISVATSLAGAGIILFAIWQLAAEGRFPVYALLHEHANPSLAAPWMVLARGSTALVFATVVCLMAWFHTRRPNTAWFSLMIATFVATAALLSWRVLQPSIVTAPLFVWGARANDALQSILVVGAALTWPRAVVRADFEAAQVWWMRTPRLRAWMGSLLTGWHLWLLVVPLAVAAPILRNTIGGTVLYGFLFLPPLAILHVSFASGERDERRRVFWFFETVLLLLMLFVVRNLLVELLPFAGQAWLQNIVDLAWRFGECAVMTGCLVIGVFFVGAVSPTVAVRRTIVFGTVISVLLFIVLIGEEYGIQQIEKLTGVRGDFASAVLCAACGIAFEPFRMRLNKALKRILPVEHGWSAPPLAEANRAM